MSVRILCASVGQGHILEMAGKNKFELQDKKNGR
jgi:hypothetical protein